MGSFDIAERLNDIATDPARDPADRIAALRRLKDQIDAARPDLGAQDAEELLGQADRYVGDLELQREAQAIGQQLAVTQAREDADVRDLLVADGVDPAELDAAGWPSHDALDQAQQDGSLYESVSWERIE